MQCTKKGWLPRGNIDDYCNHCCIHDDSPLLHLRRSPVRLARYCNYSEAQTDMTYDPEAGVFSDFEPCFQCPSCLGYTAFKDDKHTVISLGSSVFNLLLNGDPYTVPAIGAEQVRCSSKVHSVLAWLNSQCSVLCY
ncbi:uncharacterized protein LOC121865293 [Homarus americanus]|uniref:uncharacterized protein LOC121865293 n=1 Tax=Homarus americanus TaxID=6706 RepID=UPI001C43D05B|nr:uncharacterized protein LOC121865293 [Homarus americanus]